LYLLDLRVGVALGVGDNGRRLSIRCKIRPRWRLRGSGVVRNGRRALAYDPRPTYESLCEVVLHCIECFGVDRSMFGSDFPVGRLWASFDAIFDGFKTIVRDFSEDEQLALFHANARRVYRIDEPPGNSLKSM
jgi:predicted TIM-barrel fold metal-dependent hydrolase